MEPHINNLGVLFFNKYFLPLLQWWYSLAYINTRPKPMIMKKLILSISTIAAFAITPAFSQNFAANNVVVTEYQNVSTLVFPNPAINSTTVALNYIPTRRTFVDIVDFNGNIRRTYAFAPGGNKLTVEVGFLEQGYYALRIREANTLIDRVKFVKG